MKKLAFHFLIYDEIFNEELWYNFFKDVDKNKYSIIIQSKNYSKPLKYFENFKIKPEETIQTNYADISIVSSLLNLYKKTIQDENNYKFINLSQSCIPIKSFDYIYEILTQNENSYFNFCENGEQFPNCNSLLQFYSKDEIQKSHSYFILNRESVSLCINNEKSISLFKEIYAPVEIYFATTLKNSKNVINKSTTFTNWSDKGLKVYDSISDKELEKIKIADNFFARKFNDNCKVISDRGYKTLSEYFYPNNIEIEAVVVWGHPLHSHTHSYIHNAFTRAFDYLKYKWYWIDNKKPFSSYNIILPEKCLYITEGQVDSNIPLNRKSYYVLHNCEMKKYRENIPYNHILNLQVYTNKCLNFSKPLNDFEFVRFDGETLYMPWGTDLHPHEIDKNIKILEEIHKNPQKICHFVGMMLKNPWIICKEQCKINDITFTDIGGFSGKNISIEENVKKVQESIIAPAFQEPWQVENGYIPCRIFKNISYGKMGITNNESVNKLFENKLIYDLDVKIATQKAIDASKIPNLDLLKDLMINIRDNHTYLNRIKDIFLTFEKII
jgi:hypothetical protein